MITIKTLLINKNEKKHFHKLQGRTVFLVAISLEMEKMN